MSSNPVSESVNCALGSTSANWEFISALCHPFARVARLQAAETHGNGSGKFAAGGDWEFHPVWPEEGRRFGRQRAH